MSTVSDIGNMQYQYKSLTPPKASKPDVLKEACIDFSSLFVKQMLTAMKKTIYKSGLMDGGMAEDIFEDMLYDEYAKDITRSSNFGLAEMMYKELSK